MEIVKNADHRDKVSRRKRKWKLLVSIIGLLVCIRIAIPYVILFYANQKLASLQGYYGHIEDIDLNLYRGAYVINKIYINNVEDKDTTPFFSSPRIDLSVEWAAIFDGKLVGEVEFEKPIVMYTMGKNIGKGEIKDDSTNFIQLIKDFMPLKINRFAVTDGEIHYVDPGRSPVIDVPMTDVDMEGTGLTNVQSDTTEILPAAIRMTASLYEGRLALNTTFDPLTEVPTFDLDATMTNTALTNFNNFFTSYGKFDVEKGSMELYCEVAARDGEFSGYVKPLITDLKVVKLTDEEGNALQIAWEALVGGALEVFSNQSKDQFAGKVSFDGKFRNPDVDLGNAIISVLRNAFIEALKPSLDNDVSLGTVHKDNEKPGIIDRLFNRDGKDKKKSRKKINKT